MDEMLPNKLRRPATEKFRNESNIGKHWTQRSGRPEQVSSMWLEYLPNLAGLDDFYLAWKKPMGNGVWVKQANERRMGRIHMDQDTTQSYLRVSVERFERYSPPLGPRPSS